VEDFPFELDNENLKRVTGLKKLVGEKDTNSEKESEDEVVEQYDDDAVGTGNKGGDIVSKEKEEVDERRKSVRCK